MNYIGEDVTQRDIEYIIEKPSKFYNSKGEVMENPSGEEDLYVLDVWGKPKKLVMIHININQQLFKMMEK